MINKNEKQVALAFGTGDICVNGGSYGEYGIVAFSNQPSREIGTEGNIKAGHEYTLDDFPVVMSFLKPESIDVVIQALQDARADMTLGCDSRKNGMCSARDYGMNKYEKPCYKCCYGCIHAIEMSCPFVCDKVTEYYHPEEE